jgi:hypothetical protein
VFVFGVVTIVVVAVGILVVIATVCSQLLSAFLFSVG